MPDRSVPDAAPAMREAFAQWHLAARTAVKKSSSLPSSVFDTCDPMLEACLAETVQQLMDKLQQPGTYVDPQDAPTELHLEPVTPAEIAPLRRLVMNGSAEVDPARGRTAELLAVALDVLVSFPSPDNDGALDMLCKRFGIGGLTDIEAATATLAAAANATLVDDFAGDDPDAHSERQVAALCGELVAAVLAQDRMLRAAERRAAIRRSRSGEKT